MNPLEKFERAIGKVLRPATGQPREPIEIRREVIRAVVDQLQPAGGGEYLFPYSGIHLELFAADPAGQPPLEAIFSLPGFADDVRAALADRGCKVPKLEVQVEVKVEESAAPYRIVYQRSNIPKSKAGAPRPRARLTVLEGQANTQELEIDRDLVYLGRLKDVVSSSNGLERRNHLAFDAAESTVSRKHARIEYDNEAGRFRLFNDPERTSISRDGRAIPCDATRGVQLRSGDELVLGKARVRFEVDPA